jgi:2-phosphosulfolactate phosphatase
MPRIHLEWGLQGLLHSASAQAVAIVDVLSFSTCIDVACGRGAKVWPCVFKDDPAAALAHSLQAQLAGRRGQPGPTLSPASLQTIDAGARLVLPSPNGSALSAQSQALAAQAAFALHRGRLHDVLCTTDSGRELIERGFADDLHWACALNTSRAQPRLIDGAYQSEAA